MQKSQHAQSAARQAPAERLIFLTNPGSAYSAQAQLYQYLLAGGRRAIYCGRRKPSSQLTKELQGMVQAAQEVQACVLVKEHLELVESCKAQGFHIAGHYQSPTQVRERLGTQAVVGLTIHSPQELDQLTQAPIDYILAGPFAPSPAAGMHSAPIGLEGIAAICQRAQALRLTIPIYAYGNVENIDVRALLAARCFGVAVSDGIALAANIQTATQKYLERIATNTR